MSVRRLFASMSVTLTVKATCRPSGDTRGSVIRSIASMSRTEKGWVSAAAAARAASRITRTRMRRMASSVGEVGNPGHGTRSPPAQHGVPEGRHRDGEGRLGSWRARLVGVGTFAGRDPDPHLYPVDSRIE